MSEIHREETTTFPDTPYKAYKVAALPTDGPIYKVTASSPTLKLASAICLALRNREKIYLSAIGAGAVNQALKACIIARHRLCSENFTFYLIPAFESNVVVNANIDNPEVFHTAINIFFKCFRESDREEKIVSNS